MKLSLYFFGLIAIITASIPPIFMKKYNITKNINLVIFSIISFVICVYTYSKLFTKNNYISIIYPILHLLTLIWVACFGILIFNEKINIYNIMGLGFASVAVILLSISYNK